MTQYLGTSSQLTAKKSFIIKNQLRPRVKLSIAIGSWTENVYISEVFAVFLTLDKYPHVATFMMIGFVMLDHTDLDHTI